MDGVMAYESTGVQVERSQAGIRRLLAAHGATKFAFGEDTSDGIQWAILTFGVHGRMVRMRVPFKTADSADIERKARRSRTKTTAMVRADETEQEARRIWRVVAWNLKARLIAVEEGIETFEEAFLAHLLDERTGMTIYETLAQYGQIEMTQPLGQIEAGA